MKTKRQFGDFQTPVELVYEILAVLGPIGQKWDRVLEPTCGQGNFIAEIIRSEHPPKEIIGVEIQDSYCLRAQNLTAKHTSRVVLLQENIFNISLNTDLHWETSGPLLVIGNPPWVTNSEIGALNGDNLPKKSNFKGLRGIEALTGRANFDLAECILLKLIDELKFEDATIALLCKTAVARNVLKYAFEAGVKISHVEMRKFEAKTWFGVAVEACLFSLRLGNECANYRTKVFSSLRSPSAERQIEFKHGHLIADIDLFLPVSFADGKSPIEWRQGVKHDAAAIMELEQTDGAWQNGLGEIVDLEEAHIFPLIKSSDIHKFAEGKTRINRGVILTHAKLDEDTGQLKITAPRLWQYLKDHEGVFASRKSSIYKGKPSFSMFGVGNYTFSSYKVLVSGFYKKPLFIAVGPYHGKPVLCDDTCYLLPCQSDIQACAIATILNSSSAQQLIGSISFEDAKRPITKGVLNRINFEEIANHLNYREIKNVIEEELHNMKRSCEAPTIDFPVDMQSALALKHYAVQPSLFL